MENKPVFPIWYIFIGLLLAWVLTQEWMAFSHHIELSYSDFKKVLASHQVSDLTIGKEEIQGSITTEGIQQVLPPDKAEALTASGADKYTFTTLPVNDPNLINDLQAAQINYSGAVESTFLSNLLTFILPLIIFVLIWQFMFSRMGKSSGGLLSIGKSKARIYAEHDIKINFNNVAGIDEAVEEVREVVSFLQHPER
ncbi:MAG: ATP-dependent metallopeptidase FtsH/Yme1/Tma family protein, partial [Gammaproteobacteria bacterium]